MKLMHVHHWTFDKLICAISIICLAVVLVLVLVLKDSLGTYFKSLSLSWSLGVRSMSLSLSLEGQVQEVIVLFLVLEGHVLVLVLVLGGQVLVLVLGVRSLLTSLTNLPNNSAVAFVSHDCLKNGNVCCRRRGAASCLLYSLTWLSTN